MKVPPISNKLMPFITDIKNSVANKTNTKSASKIITSGSILGSLFLYINRNNDIEYKKELLTSAGINPNKYYKTRSILGPSEIKNILSELSFSAQNYAVGENLENVKSGRYRANLHIHTINSDGLFTTQELLDKATEYGDFLKKINKNNPPFTIAITDHDTTEGIEEATKIIADNPEKYKNLQVIMGAEITVFDNIATDIVNSPTNVHVLLYGINPNEEKFKNFIENTKKIKFETAVRMFDVANEVYKSIYNTDSDFSTEEAKIFSTQFRESVTGMFNHVDRYIKTKFLLDEIVLKNQELKNSLKKSFTPNELMQDLSEYYKPINGNNYPQDAQTIVIGYLSANTNLENDGIKKIIETGLNEGKNKEFIQNLDAEFEDYKITSNPKYRYAPTFDMLNEALSNQEKVLVGIAHPISYIKNIRNIDDGFSFIEKMYDKFKNTFKEKGAFCETYYQSYTKQANKINEQQQTPKVMKQLADRHGLYSSGGLDNHRNNLFSRY